MSIYKLMSLLAEGTVSTEDPALKSAARKLNAKGIVRIETYPATSVVRTKRGNRLCAREGYHVSLAEGLTAHLDEDGGEWIAEVQE